MPRAQADHNIFPLSYKAEPFHRIESTIANSDVARVQLDQHFELVMKLELGGEGIDDQAKISLAHEEPAVTSNVEFLNTRQLLAEAIFVVMKESFRLNAEKQEPVFGALNVQLTQQFYSAQLDISTPMDSIVGTKYSGYEPWLVLAKTRKQSIVQDRPQITMHSLSSKQDEYLNSPHSTLKNQHAELSAVVGSPVTVLPNTYVVASPVPWHGRIICTIRDWVTALEGLGKAKGPQLVSRPIRRKFH